MIGLSGGGWTTAVEAAIDPRIKLSIPVAGLGTAVCAEQDRLSRRLGAGLRSDVWRRTSPGKQP